MGNSDWATTPILENIPYSLDDIKGVKPNKYVVMNVIMYDFLESSLPAASIKNYKKSGTIIQHILSIYFCLIISLILIEFSFKLSCICS